MSLRLIWLLLLFVFWRRKAHEQLKSRICFVAGFPRSGTTLTLNLLRGHPEMSHLRGRKSSSAFSLAEAQSLETGILIGRESLIDDLGIFYIVARRYLAEGRPIVEKTPAHVFAYDRAVRIFGKPQFVIIVRDGRDVVASMLRASRNPKNWWRDAPPTMEAAIDVYQDYARAISKLKDREDVLFIRYEDLMADQRSHCAELCNFLGVSGDHIDGQIEFANDDQNLPFPEVRGKGAIEGFSQYLTAVEIDCFDDEFHRLNATFGYSASRANIAELAD